MIGAEERDEKHRLFGVRRDRPGPGDGLHAPRPDGGIGLAGGLPGSNAALEVCGGGVTIAALSNADPPEHVADEARRLWGCAEGP